MAGKKLVTHGGDERSEKVLRENLPQMSNPQKLSGQHSRLSRGRPETSSGPQIFSCRCSCESRVCVVWGKRQRQIRGSLVGGISACHAADTGSGPRRGFEPQSFHIAPRPRPHQLETALLANAQKTNGNNDRGKMDRSLGGSNSPP